MNTRVSHSICRPRSTLRNTALFTLMLSAFGLAACGDGGDTNTNPPPVPSGPPVTTQQLFGRFTYESINKIDLLLAIDNSRSMADKQMILSIAIPDLVKGLLNPICIDANGNPAAQQPQSPLEPCPIPGTWRSFKSISDVHIGVISSSLGGHGADACPDSETATCPASANISNNDKGHLLSRLDPCSQDSVTTYDNKGFLAWDLKQKYMPPGEANLDNLSNSLRDMVQGVGQIGCGYEAQLESWYRFLADPEPYETISIINGKAVPEGLDSTLLAQRADFLRPNSLLAIVMLSDENDCSIKEFGQFFYAAQLKDSNGMPFQMPRARTECTTDPNDPCCLSCGGAQGGCPTDPTCFDANGNVLRLSPLGDSTNLRCFDQKRRFGIDFLYPIDRYTQALQSPTVPNRSGELVPNPIFSDLNPLDEHNTIRDSGLVFLAGIVGVPWQDIARNKDDLKEGFKNSDELWAKDFNSGLTTWDIILGDPADYVQPKDPLMIESFFPRTGKNPITGDPLVPPGMGATNPINGSEWTVKMQDDLQYACVFDLPVPRDCGDPNNISCDCKDPINDNPLCQPNPMDLTKRTYQTKAKAYPGIRELSVIKSLGSQGIAASVCPAQLVDPSAADYGYRPAIGAIIDRLDVGFSNFSNIIGPCLPVSLTVDEQGQVSCLAVEARHAAAAQVETCNQCLEPGREALLGDERAIIDIIKEDPANSLAQWNCFCKIVQLKGEDLKLCQDDSSEPIVNPTTSQTVNGFCYIDATTTPPIGNSDFVNTCFETSKVRLRLTGGGQPLENATGFLACTLP